MAIANATVTKALLDKYNVSAKKRFGQNFIIDPSVVIKIASESGTTPETTVLEIGPGLGALSEQLALRSKRVVAFEIDPDMINILKESVKDYAVEVISGDFLAQDLSPYQHEAELIVCANVPYNITTPILFKLIEAQLPIKSMTLMVQKELAQRLGATVNTKEYNALSIMMDYLFERKLIMKVPPHCFLPRPKVESQVIQLTFKEVHDNINRTQFFEFLRNSFTQRRKTIFNNLRTFLDVELIRKGLLSVGIDESRRPESISLEEFLKLYEVFYGTN